MGDLRTSITTAFGYLSSQSVDVPADIWYKAVNVLKANIGDIGTINGVYHDAITNSLITYFEGGSIVSARNAFKQAMVEAFGSMWDSGWVAGGGTLPANTEALAWFNARLNQELSFIDSLFAQARTLRGEEGFDYFMWVNERADGYTRTVNDVYNFGRMYAAGSKMLTFTGIDGRPDNICQRNHGTCVRLKGKRHRASWWINHGLVPYRGNANYDCGAWECEHYLADDDGNRFTI
jgi:hypothetical protein